MFMPGLSLRSWVVIASVSLLVMAVRGEEGRIARAKQRASEYALEASNARAERDSTRQVGNGDDRVARVLRDSLRLAERMVVQKAQRQDDLDRALRRERRARYVMAARADSLAVVARAQAEDADEAAPHSVRRARFAVRQAPYTVSAEVAMPEPPDTATMSVHVALDELHLEARIGCAAANASGIREAAVSVAGPKWAAIRFDRVEQSPDLCASPALSPRRGKGGIPMVFGAGPVLGQDGRVRLALFIGVGATVPR